LADDPKTGEEGFLSRWARRKADAAAADEAPDVQVETASLGNPPPAPENAAGKDAADEEAAVDLSTLPDVDSLDESSDFSVFMQNGIPEELQRRALHKLWRLDPAFGHVDGLLEYGEDFTGTGLAAEIVNTVYKVGKGMAGDFEDDRPANDEPSDLAGAEIAEAGTTEPVAGTAGSPDGTDSSQPPEDDTSR
jgi:hypothetical protein